MKVRYRANGEIAELTEDAARQLVDAGICERADDAPGAASTPVAPLTTDSMPVRPKRVR